MLCFYFIVSVLFVLKNNCFFFYMVTSVYCWGKIWSMQNRAKTKRKLHYTYIILNPNIFQSFGNFVFRNKVETGERSVCLGKYPLVNTKATDG